MTIHRRSGTSDTGQGPNASKAQWQNIQPGQDHSHMNAYGTTSMLPQDIRENTGTGAVVNGGYVADAPACAITFAAPPTGRIYVTITANNTAGVIWESWELREKNASGTIIAGFNDAHAVELGGNNQAAQEILLEGLTPGKQYYCRTGYRTNAGAGNIASRRLLIKPVV